MARSGSSNSGPRHYIRVNLLKPSITDDEDLQGSARTGSARGPAQSARCPAPLRLHPGTGTGTASGRPAGAS